MSHPHLSLLEGPNGSRYPPEVCDILPDQGFKGELTNKEHAKAMLDVACKPPKENANEIVNRGIGMLGFRDSNPVLGSFGISVGTEMVVVPGRVLDKPGLSYSSSARAIINEHASWNLRDVKFAVGARLDRWAVLVIQDDGEEDFRDARDPELRKITDGFRSMCNKSGMRVQPLKEQAYAEVGLPRQGNREGNRFRDDAIEAIERVLRTLIAQAAPELVLIMLSNDDKAIYNGLKRLCDVQLDIPTVCMQSEKVRKDRGQPQYFANVALKVNMKLGGINHKLGANSGAWLKSASTMIMGMDVTHPARGTSADGTRKHLYAYTCWYDLTKDVPDQHPSWRSLRASMNILHNIPRHLPCAGARLRYPNSTPVRRSSSDEAWPRLSATRTTATSSGTCSLVASSCTRPVTTGNCPSELFYTAMGSPRCVYSSRDLI